MEPVVAQLQEEYGERVDFKSYNTSKERGKADKYGIAAVPTFLFINSNGEIVNKAVGRRDLADMRSYVENIIPPEEQ